MIPIYLLKLEDYILSRLLEHNNKQKDIIYLENMLFKLKRGV